MSIENVTAQLYLQEGNFNLLLQKGTGSHAI
jgi:hypothetical protein